MREFRDRHRLDQVVVVNVASTEPTAEPRPEHADLAPALKEWDKRDKLAFLDSENLSADQLHCEAVAVKVL